MSLCFHFLSTPLPLLLLTDSLSACVVAWRSCWLCCWCSDGMGTDSSRDMLHHVTMQSESRSNNINNTSIFTDTNACLIPLYTEPVNDEYRTLRLQVFAGPMLMHRTMRSCYVCWTRGAHQQCAGDCSNHQLPFADMSVLVIQSPASQFCHIPRQRVAPDITTGLMCSVSVCLSVCRMQSTGRCCGGRNQHNY